MAFSVDSNGNGHEDGFVDPEHPEWGVWYYGRWFPRTEQAYAGWNYPYFPNLGVRYGADGLPLHGKDGPDAAMYRKLTGRDPFDPSNKASSSPPPATLVLSHGAAGGAAAHGGAHDGGSGDGHGNNDRQRGGHGNKSQKTGAPGLADDSSLGDGAAGSSTGGGEAVQPSPADVARQMPEEVFIARQEEYNRLIRTDPEFIKLMSTDKFAQARWFFRGYENDPSFRHLVYGDPLPPGMDNTGQGRSAPAVDAIGADTGEVDHQASTIGQSTASASSSGRDPRLSRISLGGDGSQLRDTSFTPSVLGGNNRVGPPQLHSRNSPVIPPNPHIGLGDGSHVGTPGIAGGLSGGPAKITNPFGGNATAPVKHQSKPVGPGGVIGPDGQVADNDGSSVTGFDSAMRPAKKSKKKSFWSRMFGGDASLDEFNQNQSSGQVARAAHSRNSGPTDPLAREHDDLNDTDLFGGFNAPDLRRPNKRLKL